jgi:hypothetical protein
VDCFKCGRRLRLELISGNLTCWGCQELPPACTCRIIRNIDQYGYEEAPSRMVWRFIGWCWPFKRKRERYCPACEEWKASLPWNGATGLCSDCPG